MPSNKHIPPVRLSIDDLGLEQWINAGRYKQNGYGWKDFDLWCSDDIRMPVAVMARIFNKTDKTIQDWKRRRSELDNK
jgi:hypothetical protein